MDGTIRFDERPQMPPAFLRSEIWRLNVFRFNKISAFTLALTVALAACSDGAGPDADPFDPNLSAADLQVVQDVFSATMFESLAVSSNSFNLVPDTGSAAPALIQAGWAAATGDSHWEAESAARQLEAFLATGPASVTLIPAEWLGRTYERDAVDGYWWNPDRTGAPTNGVRFILYAVDPVTDEPTTTEVGYVDIMDESTDLSFIARVVVVSGGVEHINYTVSATFGTQTFGFEVSGFIGNGTDVVNVDLSVSFTHAEPTSTATVTHVLSVPSRDFEVNATRVLEFNRETFQGSMDLDATFLQAAHTVAISGVITFGEGDVPFRDGTFEFFVDGQLFATVTLSDGTVTVVNADGGDLTTTEAQAVRNMHQRLESIFDDRFDDFVRPVSRLFDAF